MHFFEASLLQDGKRLFTAFHNKQRRKEIRKQQFKKMYKLLQIKKVVRKYAGKTIAKIDRHHKQHDKKSQVSSNEMPNETIILSNTSLPVLTNVEYYGCEKNTRSCIGTVFGRKPFYVYLERNTPPCCLEKLKTVFNHVLEELENVGIRYWLDNFALKSAIETNQLAHDAYEIDISFNSFDLDRSSFLKKAQTRPVIDSMGFYWIKATDGQYFRVQYSKQNQIGVNLLPFVVSDRVRANGKFFGWKAVEFSAEFLHPMSTVIFLNKNVMSPNNVRDFLNLKKIF